MVPASCPWNSSTGEDHRAWVISHEPAAQAPDRVFLGQTQNPLKSPRLQAAQTTGMMGPPFRVRGNWIFNDWFLSHTFTDYRSHYSKVYTVKLTQIFQSTFPRVKILHWKKKKETGDQDVLSMNWKTLFMQQIHMQAGQAAAMRYWRHCLCDKCPRVGDMTMK